LANSSKPFLEQVHEIENQNKAAAGGSRDSDELMGNEAVIIL